MAEINLKEMILAALEHAGGVDYLAWVANEEPASFMALLSNIPSGELQDKLAVLVKGYTDEDTANYTECMEDLLETY